MYGVTHAYVALLRRLQVFTSTSTAIFKTFACDDGVGGEERYLRDDYSLMCDTPLHRRFKIYAGLMILVSNTTTTICDCRHRVDQLVYLRVKYIVRGV